MKIKVGGHTVTIRHKELENATGEWDSFSNEIALAKGMPQSQAEAALIHEILCHGINSTFSSQHIGHAMLDSMSEQLYQVLRDNGFLSEKFAEAAREPSK